MISVSIDTDGEMKECLSGKTFAEIQELVKQLDLPGFTAKQIVDWLYKLNIGSIDEMTNLSKATRLRISEKYEVGKIAPVKCQVSSDGTKKYLFETRQNQYIEAAFIPEENRNTLCLSSQVGCKMGCLFCMTGKQGFQSNLTSNEIINQALGLPEFSELTNLVYMGMGEPMDNIDEVLKSLSVFTSEWGLAWSPRRINVSTIGIVPPMKRFIEETEVHLAVSLHSPFHEERKSLMPVEVSYPAEEVVELLRQYDFGRQRRISFEYIMFRDLNDTPAHIKGLTRLLNGIRCRINLIHYHAIPANSLQGSTHETMEWFKNELNRKGLTATIRKSRGQDIEAACGLLSTRELVMKNRR